MKKYFEVLKKCPLFADIENKDLSAMLECLGAKVVAYEKGETIISEGDSVGIVGVVLTGSVRIERTDYFGNRSIVGTVEATEIFGESFACAGVQSMPVNVEASEDCRVLMLRGERITHPCSNACDFHRHIIYNLMRIMAMKNLAFHQKIEITSRRTTREKLMAYLMLEAKRAGSRSFEIPYDRQALADYLEVDRSGLSAEIGKLRREKIIKSNRNQFELL